MIRNASTLQLRGFVDGEPKKKGQITSVVDAVAAEEDYEIH